MSVGLSRRFGLVSTSGTDLAYFKLWALGGLLRDTISKMTAIIVIKSYKRPLYQKAISQSFLLIHFLCDLALLPYFYPFARLYYLSC